MQKILVIGSSNVDVLVNVPHIPKIGETIMGGKCLLDSGGKGANQAVAAKRSGGEVTFISCISDDFFGQMVLQAYKKDGINTDYIQIIHGETNGMAQIMVDDAGHNLIAVAPGTNNHLTPELVTKFKDVITQHDIILLQLEIPIESVYTIIDIAKNAGKIIILNPAPAQPMHETYLAQLDFITPNETEAEILTGIKVVDEETAKKAANWFLAHKVKNVLITLGKNGVYLANAELHKVIKGFNVKAVDTTGAGDSFNGGFVTGLSKNMSLENAAIFGQKVAALSVTKIGTQNSMPHLDEINNFV